MQMKELTDKNNLDFAQIEQTSNFEIQKKQVENNTKVHAINETILDENQQYNGKWKKMEHDCTVKIDAEMATVNLKKVEFDLKYCGLDRLKWVADHEITQLDSQQRMERNRLAKELEINFAKKEFQNEVDNLDDKVLEYRAMLNTEHALNNKIIYARSSEVKSNDSVNKMVKGWFDAKAAAK